MTIHPNIAGLSDISYGLYIRMQTVKHLSDVQEKRAYEAELSSFIGAVVDWYDVLIYGIVAALLYKDQFFPVLMAIWVSSLLSA